MCGIDESKLLGVGLPGQGGGLNLNGVDGPQGPNHVGLQTIPEVNEDDFIDTSNHVVEPEMPDVQLQEQLDRLMTQASKVAFGSVSKEELEAALLHTHLTCAVEFHGRKIGLDVALQLYRAMPENGKGSVQFGEEQIPATERQTLYAAIRHAQVQEETVNRAVLRLQEKADLTMKKLGDLDKGYQRLNDPNSTDSATVRHAVEAQMALGDKLMELINSSVVEDTAEIEVLQRKCLMRAVEINQLAVELGKLAVNADFQDGKAEVLDEVNTLVVESGKANGGLLQKKFVGMLSGMAAKMHGTQDVLRNFQEDMDGVLAQLAKFQHSDPDEKALFQIHEFETQVARMRQMVANARKNGVQLGDGVVRLDEGLLEAMEKRLEEGVRNVRDISQRTLGIALKKVIHAEISKYPLGFLDGFEELLQDPHWTRVREAHDKLKALRTALIEMCENYQGKASLDRLKLAFQELKELTMEADFYEEFSSQFMEDFDSSLHRVVTSYAKRHPEKADLVRLASGLEKIHSGLSGQSCFAAQPLCMLARHCEAIGYIVNHIVSMGENFDRRIRGGELESNRMYDAVFQGKLPVTTAVEARIHSVELEDVAKGTSDEERTKISRQGNGSCNTVFYCKYANGNEYIYKPEITGRSSLSRMSFANGTGAFQSQQTILNLNVATSKCADLLGIGKRVVKTKAGVVNGRFGLMMEVAQGNGSQEWRNHIKTPRAQRELKNLIMSAPGGKEKVFGHMQRQMNELHWLDMLTGQGDRHQDNFKVDFGPNGEVTVQGIDNDCCFGDIMVGVNTYELNADMVKKFTRGLAESVRDVYGYSATAKTVLAKIKSEILDFLPSGSKPGSLVVDLNRITNIFVVNTMRDKMFGFQTCALPDRISREMYDKLRELKENPTMLEDALKRRVSARALENAKVRLEQLWEHAQKLEQAHMVMGTEDDWANSANAMQEVKPNEADFAQLLLKQGLPPARFHYDAHYNYIMNTCQDYFQRDYVGFMRRVTA